MAGPYISSGELKQAIADRLGYNVDELPSHWDRLANECVEQGYRDCAAVLSAQGYTQAQIDAWDDRKLYNRLQGVFRAMVAGATLTGFDWNVIKEMDQRETLKTLSITTNGVQVYPAARIDGEQYPVTGGRLSETDYRFGMDKEW